MIALMFDSNIWDKLEKDLDAFLVLEACVQRCNIQVLTTSIQETENQTAPSSVNFQRMKERLKTRTVPSESFVLGYARLDIDKLASEATPWVTQNGSRNRDEVIGQTAERNGAWLITEDKALRKDAAARGLKNYTLSELLDILKSSKR